jgi:quaternary ammonium compound-resistance protein SugE
MLTSLSTAAIAWLYLVVAGLFEVAFTTALRFVEGFTRPLPTALFVVCATASFYFLQKSISGVPLGTAYAVWTGIGAAGTALVGMLYFGEPATTLRLVFLVTLIGSIVGLKFVST